MSRHTIKLPAGRTLQVRWDPPLQTFFGALYAPEHDDGPVLWVGADLHELYDLDDLARALGPHAAALTPELALQLHRDRDDNVA